MLAVVLGLLCLLVVTGCDSAEEAAYKGKIVAIQDRWNEAGRQADVEANDWYTQMKTLVNSSANADPSAVYASLIQIVDAYVPKFQASLQKIEQIQADLNAIQPAAKYTNEHRMSVNGMNTVVVSLQQEGQAIANIRNVRTLNDVNNLTLQVNNAVEFGQQGIANLNKANAYLFSTSWATIAAIGFCVLVVFAGCGTWAGMMGRSDGRSFADYFVLGLFLGPVGLLIAWRKTRYGPSPPVHAYQQPAPAMAQGYTDQQYWPQPQPGYLEQPYSPPAQAVRWDEAPSAPAPWDAAPRQAFGPSAADVYPSDYGSCPTCGAAITVPDALFCPTCGATV